MRRRNIRNHIVTPYKVNLYTTLLYVINEKLTLNVHVYRKVSHRGSLGIFMTRAAVLSNGDIKHSMTTVLSSTFRDMGSNIFTHRSSFMHIDSARNFSSSVPRATMLCRSGHQLRRLPATPKQYPLTDLRLGFLETNLRPKNAIVTASTPLLYRIRRCLHLFNYREIFFDAFKVASACLRIYLAR